MSPMTAGTNENVGCIAARPFAGLAHRPLVQEQFCLAECHHVKNSNVFTTRKHVGTYLKIIPKFGWSPLNQIMLHGNRPILITPSKKLHNPALDAFFFSPFRQAQISPRANVTIRMKELRAARYCKNNRLISYPKLIEQHSNLMLQHLCLLRTHRPQAMLPISRNGW